MEKNMTSTFYTPEVLSKLYQIPKTTIWKMIREGQFKGVLKVGRHYRIPYEARAEFERKHLKKDDTSA